MDESLMYRTAFYIDGDWVAPESDAGQLDVVSPFSEKVVGKAPISTKADIDKAVDAARRAFEGTWSRSSLQERAALLRAVAEQVRKRETDLNAVQVEEMGIPLTAAQVQNQMIAPVFDYYAEQCGTYPFERVLEQGPMKALVLKDPVGVVGAITPWNGPTTLAMWKIAPAIAAGCTVVLKPPPESPLSPMVLAEILHEAGVPAGVVNIVPGDREVGEHLVTHPGTDKIAFTGSTAAGKRIMSLCGNSIKRVSLELGGKSAAVFLDDADVSSILPAFVGGSMFISGQVCAMHSRVLVARKLYNDVVEQAAAIAGACKVGDPHELDTVVGPLVAKRQQDRVLGYIDSAKQEGAQVVIGGKVPAHMQTGWFVEPTILSGVDNQMRVAREEIFGPVLSFIPFDSDDEAVAIANDSRFGLSGGVWSGDQERGMSVARRIRSGSLSVNGGLHPYPSTPFGGFKESGLGRELGTEGLGAYLETKAIAYP